MTGVNPLYFIVGMALLGLAPFFLMMVTSYVKIVVVTSLVRNALGVQQVPPAMVMNGLAIILSLFIMAPMMMSTMDIAEKLQISAEPSPLFTTFGTGQPIFRSSMEKGRSSIRFAISARIWGSEPNSCREAGTSSGWISMRLSVFLLL